MLRRKAQYFHADLTSQKPMLRQNCMSSTKLIYHKKWTFATYCAIFLKIWFEFKSLLQIVDLIYQLPKYINSDLWKGFSFFRGCVLPVSIRKSFDSLWSVSYAVFYLYYPNTQFKGAPRIRVQCALKRGRARTPLNRRKG